MKKKLMLDKCTVCHKYLEVQADRQTVVNKTIIHPCMIRDSWTNNNTAFSQSRKT
jgi:hypothetical protein